MWVVLCAGLGVLVGHFAPAVPEGLDKATVAHISIPVAFLIWIMVFPMLVQVDVSSLRNVRANLVPLVVTSSINYLVQPFTMYALALLFFKVVFAGVIDSRDRQDEYVAGSVILGGSPCTAMVFVWSFLVHGDATYTLVQVAFNDLLIFVFYIPTLMLLLQVTDIVVPWDTAFLSVALFMLVPGAFAAVARWYALRYRDEAWLARQIAGLKPITMVALLATLFLIFTFQGEQIINYPVDVLLIAVPLLLQSFIIFALAYGCMIYLQVPHRFAAPGALIATSNFFELAVAVAMSLFGADSGATLATVVGVLEEVPIMLALVWFCNRTLHWFPDSKVLESYLEARTMEIDALIPAARQRELQEMAAAVNSARLQQQHADVLFLSVHNSRCSQLCEAWFRLAVELRGIKGVRVFSGGAEATFIDKHTVAALRRAGFVVRRTGWSRIWPVHNPQYQCARLQASGGYHEAMPIFSKLTIDPINSQCGFIAVAVCQPEAADVDGMDTLRVLAPGASRRFQLSYQDPGKFNSTSESAEGYDEVYARICREMLFAVQHIGEPEEEHAWVVSVV